MTLAAPALTTALASPLDRGAGPPHTPIDPPEVADPAAAIDTAQTMLWRMSHRADPVACKIADRHYSRQTIGSPQFVPPGRCLVLRAETDTGRALWVTSWPFAEYVKHAWAGAWVCSMFRNENAALASSLIMQAVAATRAVYGRPPDLGIITFVKPSAIRSGNPGYCYKRAGWRLVGAAKDGKPCLQQLPEDMPPPDYPLGWQADILAQKREDAG